MTSVADADLYLNEVNPKKAIGSNAGIYVEENELKKELRGPPWPVWRAPPMPAMLR